MLIEVGKKLAGEFLCDLGSSFRDAPSIQHRTMNGFPSPFAVEAFNFVEANWHHLADSTYRGLVFSAPKERGRQVNRVGCQRERHSNWRAFASMFRARHDDLCVAKFLPEMIKLTDEAT
jgi:hypothetical protein